MRLVATFVRPLLVVLILLAAAIALFNAFRTPPAWTLAVGAPNDGAFAVNFYRSETSDGETYRWSGPGSQLRLPTLYTTPILLALRMHTIGDKPQSLRLLLDNQSPITVSVGLNWRTYRVLLPQSASNNIQSAFNITLDAPTQQPNSRDPRELGVALSRVTLVPLNGTEPLNVVLTRTVLFGMPLMVLVLAIRRWSISYWSIVLVAGLAAALVAWARYDAASMLPVLPVLSFAPLMYSIITAGWPDARFIAGNAFRRLRQRHVRAMSIGVVVLFAHLALAFPAQPVDLRGAAAWLLLLLPGALLAWLIFREDTALPALLALALCGGVALITLLMLALHVLPGSLPGWLVLACCDAISAWVGWLLWKQGYQGSGVRGQRSGTQGDRKTGTQEPNNDAVVLGSRFSVLGSRFSVLLLAVLLLGAALRLPWLGGAEFHDDEAAVLLMATGVANGQDDILMLHRKGPVEILLPAAPLVVTGQVTEFTARLPFALASVGALLAVYALAQALLPAPRGQRDRAGAVVGLFAALALALDGFLIAYARTVQYQSVIVLMSLGALWCAWRFYVGAEGRRYLVGAAVFASVALLAHWDGVFALPALGWLVLAGAWRRGWRADAWLRGLAWPLGVGALLTGSFYVPFVLHPHFKQTTDYLSWRVGQQGSVFNNLPSYYDLATFYNTRFQMIALGVALFGTLLAGLWRYVRVGKLPLHWLACALLVLGCALAFSVGGAVNERTAVLILLLFALPLAALIVAPATPAALRTLALWFAPPFLAEGFLVASPRTHFYTMDTAAALLVGLGVGLALAKLRGENRAPMIGRYALATLVLLPFAVSIPYAYLVFVRQEPEYQRTFPANRPAIYQASYGDERPDEAFLFGFPRRDGWKVIAELYRRGVLHGDYNTNQKPEIAGWYTRDVPRCDRDPANYFVAWGAAQIGVPARYHRTGDVYVDGVRAISIFQRAPVSDAVRRYDLSDFRSAFDNQRLAPFPTASLLAELTPQHPLDVRWQNGAWLRGYDLNHATLRSGATATLWLYWQPTTALEKLDLALDVLDAQGQVVAQAAPYCAPPAPADWPAGALTITAYSITATAHMPPGHYRVQVALKQADQQIAPLSTGAQTTVLTTLTVTP